MVVLDDLHWAEPGLLDLVEHVADYGRGAPILLVAMARPEFLEDRPGWAGGKLNATTLLLEPLGDAEAAQLLAALAGPVTLPEAATGPITKAAGGNPLFLEELLAALVEEGRLRRRDGEWVAADLADLGIPPSIQALLTARLDRLDEAERAVLERAAVAGQVFDQSAVVALSPPSVRAQVPARLQALVRRELLRPVPARLAGDQGFQFRHLLLRDATYDSIPKQARAELHELFAVWGERTAGARLREIEEIVGYHLEQAWRYRVELGIVDERNQRLAGAAARRLGSAGRRALGRGDLPAASKLLERAVEPAPGRRPGRPGAARRAGRRARLHRRVRPRRGGPRPGRGGRRRPRRRAPGRPRRRRPAADGGRGGQRPGRRRRPAPRPGGPSPPSPSSRTSGAWPRRGGCWPPSGSCAAASPRPRRPPARP